jgi:predicted nucleic acid-binding Zn finger protein
VSYESFSFFLTPVTAQGKKPCLLSLHLMADITLSIDSVCTVEKYTHMIVDILLKNKSLTRLANRLYNSNDN